MRANDGWNAKGYLVKQARITNGTDIRSSIKASCSLKAACKYVD